MFPETDLTGRGPETRTSQILPIIGANYAEWAGNYW